MRVDWIPRKPRPEYPSSDARDSRERRIQTLLTDAYPERMASPALYARVAAAAQTCETAGGARSTSHRRALRVTVALLALAAALAVLISSTPSWVGAAVLRRAQTALDHAARMESVTWSVAPGGSQKIVSQTWTQNGDWRIEEPQRVRLFASGRLWIYDRASRRLTVQSLSRFVTYPSSGFSLGAIRRDEDRWGWDRIRDLGQSTLDGRPVERVAIQRPDEAARELLLVDRATDLPVEALLQVDHQGNWITQSVTRMRYPARPMPRTRFQPHFPGTASVLNINTAKAAWLRRIAAGLAQRVVGDRKIVVRDLEVNADGIVFALYTIGRRLSDTRPRLTVDLSDERRTRYVRPEGSIAPFTPDVRIREIALHGAQLEAQIWIPLVPQNSTQPGRYTLTFHTPATAPQTANAAPSSIRFTLRASRTAGVTPPYMIWIPEDPNADDLVHLAASQRAEFYLANRQYLRAVALFQQVVAEDRVKASRSFSAIRDPQTWFGLYQALAGLGREDEAYRALIQARDETDFRGNNDPWRQIEAAIAGMDAFRKGKARPPIEIISNKAAPSVNLSDLAPVGVPRYRLEDLGETGDLNVNAMNTAGEAAAETPDGRGVILRNGTAQRLPTLAGGHFHPVSMNRAGALVGWADTANGAWHGFMYDHREMVDLGIASADPGSPISINDAGDIAGTTRSATGNSSAFVWPRGSAALLGVRGHSEGWSVNRLGVVAGASDQRAALFSRGAILDLGTLPGGEAAMTTVINDQGEAAGISISPGGVARAFIYTNGAMTPIGEGGTKTWPLAINNAGDVVGHYDGAGTEHAFLWTNHRFVDLDTAAPPGWILSSAEQIDDRGRIVGTGSYCGRGHLWRLDPVMQ